MTLVSAQQPHRPSRDAAIKPASDGFSRLDRVLRREFQRQFGYLTSSDLDALVMRRSLSQYADALTDLEVFDSQGRLIFEGREFRSMTALWAVPAAITTTAGWSGDRQTYAPPRHQLL